MNGAKRYAHSECIKFKIWHLKHTRRSTISYYSHLNITSLKFHCNTHLFKTNNFTISCTNLILRHSVWRKQRKPNKVEIFWAINNYKITIIGSKLFILLPPFLFPNKYGIKMFKHKIRRFEWKSQEKMVALHLHYGAGLGEHPYISLYFSSSAALYFLYFVLLYFCKGKW